jgi:hypothetical protein
MNEALEAIKPKSSIFERKVLGVKPQLGFALRAKEGRMHWFFFFRHNCFLFSLH